MINKSVFIFLVFYAFSIFRIKYKTILMCEIKRIVSNQRIRGFIKGCAATDYHLILKTWNKHIFYELNYQMGSIVGD